MDLIFITGVSKGLGSALSKRLAKENAKLIGFSRNRGDFQGVFHPCDLANPHTAASIFDAAFAAEDLKNASSITFIANAGILGPLDSIDNLSASDIQANIAGNLIGSAVSLSHFIKYTKNLPTPKLFIQISSGAALSDRAKPSWSLYCASKAGQEQLIRSVSKEQLHGDHPAKVINVNPGIMETSMQKMIRSTPKSIFPEVDRFIELKERDLVANPITVADGISKIIDHYNSLENGKLYAYDHFQ